MALEGVVHERLHEVHHVIPVAVEPGLKAGRVVLIQKNDGLDAVVAKERVGKVADGVRCGAFRELALGEAAEVIAGGLSASQRKDS